jgi:hypothetical protein
MRVQQQFRDGPVPAGGGDVKNGGAGTVMNVSARTRLQKYFDKRGAAREHGVLQRGGPGFEMFRVDVGAVCQQDLNDIEMTLPDGIEKRRIADGVTTIGGNTGGQQTGYFRGVAGTRGSVQQFRRALPHLSQQQAGQQDAD